MYIEKFNRLSLGVSIFLLSIICFESLIAQNKAEKKILTSFEQYAKAPREIAYVHLNKSVYIKGEMLGFTAYIFDKANKSLFTSTKNLYTIITNSNDSIIKKKLIKVDEGISSNIFKIDSVFNSGTYTIKAYTNWMLNFEEPNYFEQQFNVIDPEYQTEVKSKTANKSFTVKIFPEGGHLLSNVINNIGIIVKNRNGIGLGNANGKIINQNNELLSEFKLDAFGIAKTIITPKNNETYKVIVFNGDREIAGTITNFEKSGINMSLNKVKSGIALTFRTNEGTLNFIKNNLFKIIVHNGYDLYGIELSFTERKEVNKLIKEEDLFKGMNIITVFDNKNKPILERQYFNFKDIEPVESSSSSIKKNGDSLKIKLKILRNSHKSNLNNISISVLPTQTKSYNFHSNIFSKVYLEPYVKGFIQNSHYYFRNISDKTLYDLDNLLLTQGWSSYDWSKIFNHKPLYRYKFENGIQTIVNINGKNKSGNYLTFPLKNSSSQIFVIDDNQKLFNQSGLFPEEDEYYGIYKSSKKVKNSKPKVYINFSPSQIPDFDLDLPSVNTINSNSSRYLEALLNIKPAWKNKPVEVLDEVVITAENKESIRIEKIKNESYGNVRFLDDKMRRGMSLATYLQSYTPYNASDWDGYLRIVDPSPRFINNPVPYIILDGIIITDFGFMGRYSLDYVDYIEVNRSGLGSGLRGGGGGYIKIVTDPLIGKSNADKNSIRRQFPLAFSSPKKFYTPLYSNYNSSFFKEYGTIAWLPNLKVDENGTVDFTLFNSDMDSVTLNIEGTLDNGKFISETKTIELN